jgi:hypothetical protein
VKGGRGKGGHRVKKSDNARIQALYHRKHALKLHFKQVASLQRDALEELSLKTLKSLRDDLTYHTHLPEYKETTLALDERYAKVKNRLNAEFHVKEEYLRKMLAMNEDYANRQHEVSILYTLLSGYF